MFGGLVPLLGGRVTPGSRTGVTFGNGAGMHVTRVVVVVLTKTLAPPGTHVVVLVSIFWTVDTQMAVVPTGVVELEKVDPVETPETHGGWVGAIGRKMLMMIRVTPEEGTGLGTPGGPRSARGFLGRPGPPVRPGSRGRSGPRVRPESRGRPGRSWGEGAAGTHPGSQECPGFLGRPGSLVRPGSRGRSGPRVRPEPRGRPGRSWGEGAARTHPGSQECPGFLGRPGSLVRPGSRGRSGPRVRPAFRRRPGRSWGEGAAGKTGEV